MELPSAGRRASSAPRRRRNASRGSSRRRAATDRRPASAGGASNGAASGRASSRSIARSSSSAREGLGMVLAHLCAQPLERPELELLHRSLRPPELARDLGDALLLGEPHLDDLALRGGERPEEAEEPG